MSPTTSYTSLTKKTSNQEATRHYAKEEKNTSTTTLKSGSHCPKKKGPYTSIELSLQSLDYVSKRIIFQCYFYIIKHKSNVQYYFKVFSGKDPILFQYQGNMHLDKLYSHSKHLMISYYIASYSSFFFFVLSETQSLVCAN